MLLGALGSIPELEKKKKAKKINVGTTTYQFTA
jgi:hypothetical protein